MKIAPYSGTRIDPLLVVILTALFLLYLACGSAGYGNDGDTYAMLRSGWDLLQRGIYAPSRSPGYPLPEFLIAIGSRLAGHAGSNAISSLLGCLALACFHRLLRESFGRARSLLAVSAVGLNPYWIIASSSSMDYVYGAAFFLAALIALRNQHPFLTALCFAACVASRLTYAPMVILVYLIVIQWRPHGFSASLWWSSLAIFLLLTVSAYAPVYRAVGKAMFEVTFSDKRVPFLSLGGFTSIKPYLGRFFYKNISLWGFPAFTVILAAFAWTCRSFLKEWKTPLFVTGAVGVAILYYEILFFRLPMEISYLLPVLILVVYLLAGVAHGRAFLAVVLVCHVLQNLVAFDFMEIVYASRTLDAVEASGARFHPAFHRGALWKDLSERKETQDHYLPLYSRDLKEVKP